MDKTSKVAFEITKNVTESNAETLVNVRSGGLVGELRKEIEQLQAEKKSWRRVAEKLESKCKQLQAKNDKLLSLLSRVPDFLALVPNWNKQHGNLLNDISKALQETDTDRKDK